MAKQEIQEQKSETPSVTMAGLAAENVKLKGELEALRGIVRQLEAQLKSSGITEDIRDDVQQRIRMGLSQQDAVEVVRRQRAHDQQLKEQQTATAKQATANIA